MKTAEPEQKCETKQIEKPSQQPAHKSKFDEQEYKRWSESFSHSRGKTK